MSMFSIPDHLIPDVKQFEEMNKEINALLPTEFAGAINLMAHPVAGASAFSALGFGLASQAFGIWMGTVAGAMQASQQFFGSLTDDIEEAAAFTPKEKPAATKARATARTLIADARSIAKELSDTTEKLADEPTEAAKPVAKAAPVETGAALSEPRQPKALERPQTPDDLKQISGIGPKLEQVLNGLGIWTYGQIAKLEAAEIGWVEDYLSFKGRIGRDDWIGQAEKLARDAKAKS
ncbi:NADH-ubiquinone dehydrogenase [Mesorhizobium sp. CGMCC 1.15528]|uniref:NADH-ubiquinone dehydrogenase n=1 Tax=Mesorhizobium zhangyense TaxID=1776730 RepID=A0A7C9R5S4_9HYPH|nr:NADH-ubiquinone dehydrogenase [Mesorhizobium zhangyense]NGN40860.1 NADH-ubiquinone dehydrogenase [Mesorhizobium zhangyense]